MRRVLLLVVFTLLVDSTSLTTTTYPPTPTSPATEILNITNYVDLQNTSSDVSRANTDLNISTPNTDLNISTPNTDLNISTPNTASESKGNKPKPLVSTETKDLVVEVVNCGFLPVVCLFGIIGNIMSLVVLYIQGSQERTNIILLGLALSDTVFLILTILRKINCLVSKFDKNAGFDLNMMMLSEALVLQTIFGRVTSALTMLISIERFIAVYFPLKAQYLLTATRIKFAVGILYFLVCSALAPLLATSRTTYIYSDPFQRIIPYPQLTRFYHDNFDFLDAYMNQILNIIFRYIPMFLVLFFTTAIIIRIKKSTSWRKKTSSNAKQDENRVTSMLLLVNCIYILCLLPGTIVITLRFFIDGYSFSGTYANTFNLVGAFVFLIEALNSSVNFIVYMVMSKKFAATYKRVFLCRRRAYEYPDNSPTQNTNISTVS